ncbi:MAG: 1-(5-phosphoribosyl)-5-[(5-phosphoribosylamino)methylideneamino]imidazole-4-carboxamide isomerase [Planctomyces sp.]|nr:1-(5-phosphoribosyl)-5-[(5-phosphoribosylamino)methylideneamino]imidazole-4-carboxamide isomerase [Planctomyces sp.]
MQIYPAIDIRDGKCVRLRQGDYAQETIFGNDPAEMARQWAGMGADWLHLVDLDGAKAGKPVNIEPIKKIVEAVDIPCELGGGLRDEAGVKLVLEEIGIERAIIGTQALKEPEWFKEMIERYPGRIALGLDARDSMVATAGWLETSETSALELAKQYVGLDLGAVIYTNIANDGMMQGIDEQTLKDMLALCELGLPVIASGGVTTIDDIVNLKRLYETNSNLIGVITGRAIYEGSLDLKEAIALSRE